jgi:two-component system response regulator FlrC
LALQVAPGDEGQALMIITACLAPEAGLAATAPASRALIELAARVSRCDVSVLIEGATGTGKEGLARLIHNLSPRRDASLVAVNCAALPEAMLEATLFGHERGAFTGAVASGRGLFREADRGTLLLDEVAELPLLLQAKLLRALQEREVLPVGATRPIKVDVRLVACGNRDLAAEVAAGRFRADLYYRLAVFPLRTLPLSERMADVPAIAAAWLLRRAQESQHGAKIVPLAWPTPAALARLMTHRWPGNVRELGNVLDRAMVLGDGTTIEIADLVFDAAAPEQIMSPAVQQPALTGAVRAQEERSIARALAEAPTRRAAAARLGISERTLRYKMAGIASREPGATKGYPREMRLQ